MSARIAMVGGPADGRTFTVPGDPPMLWRVPIDQPITAAFFDDPADLAPMPVADYRLLLDHEWPSRASDGAYRYEYVSTPAPPHPVQSRPTPTLDELAEMTCDPSPAAYPDRRRHLLACRIQHSLRRDGRLTQAERDVLDQLTLAHVRAALEERRAGA